MVRFLRECLALKYLKIRDAKQAEISFCAFWKAEERKKNLKVTVV